MIRIKSGLQTVYANKEVKNESSNEGKKIKTEHYQKFEKTPSKSDSTHTVVLERSPKKEKNVDSKLASPKKSVSNKIGLNDIKQETEVLVKEKTEILSKDLPQIERQINKPLEENVSWTEKYKPKDLKSIIGQQGEKSNMNKLLNWLKNWYKYHHSKDKPKVARPSPWAKDDNGAYYKCALLSGPPGVGKICFIFSYYYTNLCSY